MADRHLAGQSRFVLRFFAAAVLVFLTAGAVTAGLIALLGPAPVVVPFTFSTLLLGSCSIFLQYALGQVRLERQQPFRRALKSALATAVLFVTVQSFALWSLLKAQNPAEAQTSADAFVLVLATLHGLHLCGALMFLLYVTLKAAAGRYDHEFYWGVSICAGFWHLLGLAWLFILGAFGLSLVA